jgi:hypothetical protein
VLALPPHPAEPAGLEALLWWMEQNEHSHPGVSAAPAIAIFVLKTLNIARIF